MIIFKEENKAGLWWHTPLIRRQRQMELCEFKGSLVYRVSSRTAKATQRNLVLKNQLVNYLTKKTKTQNT